MFWFLSKYAQIYKWRSLIQNYWIEWEIRHLVCCWLKEAEKERPLCFVEWSPNFAAAHSFRNNGKSGNWSETNPNEIRYFSPFYLRKKSVIRWPFGFSSFSDSLCRCALAWVFEFSMNFKLLFYISLVFSLLRPYSNSISMFLKL